MNTTNLIFAASNPSLVVAIAMISLVLILMVVAMIKYDVDGVLKIWGGLGTLVGILTGSMATYFFTKDVNEQEQLAAKDQIESLETQLAATNLGFTTAVVAMSAPKNNSRSEMVIDSGWKYPAQLTPTFDAEKIKALRAAFEADLKRLEQKSKVTPKELAVPK